MDFFNQAGGKNQFIDISSLSDFRIELIMIIQF